MKKQRKVRKKESLNIRKEGKQKRVNEERIIEGNTGGGGNKRKKKMQGN